MKANNQSKPDIPSPAPPRPKRGVARPSTSLPDRQRQSGRKRRTDRIGCHVSPKTSLRASLMNLSDSQRLSWQSAVRAELTQTGRMRFVPECDSMGSVLDLLFTAATPAVAQLLGEPDAEIIGRSLRCLMANRPRKDELIAAYLDVAISGRSSTHWTVRSLSNEARLVLHDISQTPDGLLLVLLRDPLSAGTDFELGEIL